MARTKGYSDPKMETKLRDRYLYRTDSKPDFSQKIKEKSRTVSHMCFQCGTCTGSCPSAPRSSYRIRLFMRRNVLGLEEEALTDPDLWLCTTCYSCTDRCPRDIAPTDVIMSMRNFAYQRGIVPVNFLKTVQAIYQSGHGVPNNDVNRAARVRLGLAKDPATTHSYPEYLPGIRQILGHFKVKEQADKIVAEAEKKGA
jgi:heterodisulfide reductase subunit C2